MSRNVKIGLRMQLPRFECVGIAWEKLQLIVTPEFEAQWRELEEAYKKHAKWSWVSCVSDGLMRVRIDEKSHVFDMNSELSMDDPAELLTGHYVTCLIDIVSVWNFKEMSGLTVRVHQVKQGRKAYLFTE